jgi:hypothetical protein
LAIQTSTEVNVSAPSIRFKTIGRTPEKWL